MQNNYTQLHTKLNILFIAEFMKIILKSKLLFFFILYIDSVNNEQNYYPLLHLFYCFVICISIYILQFCIRASCIFFLAACSIRGQGIRVWLLAGWLKLGVISRSWWFVVPGLHFGRMHNSSCASGVPTYSPFSRINSFCFIRTYGAYNIYSITR